MRILADTVHVALCDLILEALVHGYIENMTEEKSMNSDSRGHTTPAW